MKRLFAAVIAAVILTSCAQSNVPRVTERTPQYVNVCPNVSVATLTSCPTDPPPDEWGGPDTFAFTSFAMTLNRPYIMQNAVKCQDVWIDALDPYTECFDARGNMVSMKMLIDTRSIIPMPKHPGCFWAGVIGGGAILAPVTVIMQLIGLGKIALGPYPGLALMVSTGVYKTYVGC